MGSQPNRSNIGGDPRYDFVLEVGLGVTGLPLRLFVPRSLAGGRLLGGIDLPPGPALRAEPPARACRLLVQCLADYCMPTRKPDTGLILVNGDPYLHGPQIRRVQAYFSSADILRRQP